MSYLSGVKVVRIDLLNADDIENRQVKVTLSNGTEITIVRCWESWEQYGGTTDELRITINIADKYNNWLHGLE